MDVCSLWLVCVVRYRSLRRTDHSLRGVLPSVICLSMISKPQQWGVLGLRGLASHEKKIYSCVLECKNNVAWDDSWRFFRTVDTITISIFSNITLPSWASRFQRLEGSRIHYFPSKLENYSPNDSVICQKKWLIIGSTSVRTTSHVYIYIYIYICKYIYIRPLK